MIDVQISGTIPSPLTQKEIVRAFRATAAASRKGSSGSVSIAFITPARMRILNKRWRKKDRSTDVLSFQPSPEVPSSVRKTESSFGDIFLDPVYIRHEARSRLIPFREEVLRNVIHGALHLFGYEHATISEETKMFSLQERILSPFLKHI